MKLEEATLALTQKIKIVNRFIVRAGGRYHSFINYEHEHKSRWKMKGILGANMNQLARQTYQEGWI